MEYYDTPFKSMSVYDQWGFCNNALNYPFWQVLRYAAPVIMSGNVTLLKHAPNVIGCAKLSKMRFWSRFSEGVFQQITIDIPLVENVIASNIVQGITLTEVKWQDPSSFIGREAY
jgi:succinate-semialdehyde dehydrogenase/glutarate-semialdehyde dehydrogenase